MVVLRPEVHLLIEVPKIYPYYDYIIKKIWTTGPDFVPEVGEDMEKVREDETRPHFSEQMRLVRRRSEIPPFQTIQQET